MSFLFFFFLSSGRRSFCYALNYKWIESSMCCSYADVYGLNVYIMEVTGIKQWFLKLRLILQNFFP